jgi:hypothetical protein
MVLGHPKPLTSQDMSNYMRSMDNKATGLSRKIVNNLEQSETRLLLLGLEMWVHKVTMPLSVY